MVAVRHLSIVSAFHEVISHIFRYPRFCLPIFGRSARICVGLHTGLSSPVERYDCQPLTAKTPVGVLRGQSVGWVGEHEFPADCEWSLAGRSPNTGFGSQVGLIAVYDVSYLLPL